METILNKLKDVNLDEYREIIRYCESRSTGTEGIPAIIGLDDLTVRIVPYMRARRWTRKCTWIWH